MTPYELYSAPAITSPLHSLVAFCISERRSWADNFRDTSLGCWVIWCHLWPSKLCKRKQQQKSKIFKRLVIKPLPIPEKGRGTVLEPLACCVSLLPSKNNNVTLFYFLRALSLYFSLALVDREPRFWQH